jgi:hypothetical protein
MMINVLKREIHSAEALTDEHDWLVGAYSIEEKNLILKICKCPIIPTAQ